MVGRDLYRPGEKFVASLLARGAEGVAANADQSRFEKTKWRCRQRQHLATRRQNTGLSTKSYRLAARCRHRPLEFGIQSRSSQTPRRDLHFLKWKSFARAHEAQLEIGVHAADKRR